ncbi:MAG: sensor histidine kinase [Chromatiales bacterium]
MRRAGHGGELADDTSWRALRYFNLYRTVLAGLFAVLVIAGNLPPPLASHDRDVFAITVFFYLMCTLAAQVAAERRLGGHLAQTYAQVLLDVAVISVLMHASGGVTSGLGMLLVVTIAGGSILAPGRHALTFAAIASIAVLGEQFYSVLTAPLPAINYTQAGLLGLTFFASALLAYIFARRLRESEALARQRAVAIAGLERLNEHIVQRMRSGIIALDDGGQVRLMNASAARLMGTNSRGEGRLLAEIAPALSERYQSWRASGRNSARTVRGQGVEVTVAFSRLGEDARDGTLVFLEDDAMLRQRAQQMKLASLGRLAGSIAHEIRNPLGAISHAAQLLEESHRGDADERRFTEIIRDHSRRVNTIVENVMQLARRDVAVPESFELRPWLEEFVREVQARFDVKDSETVCAVVPEDLTVRMDRSQLQQVLWNLCENALRYSRDNPLLELRAGVHPEFGRPYLDVVDQGAGMSAEVEEHIFEPFFTTETGGTGLGLYIASELCEANQAVLRLESNTPRGCRFRIDFAHPARQQLTDL